jgi:fused signal recognition particle receptor
MFKFLKRKIKKFEDELEAELEQELKNEKIQETSSLEEPQIIEDKIDMIIKPDEPKTEVTKPPLEEPKKEITVEEPYKQAPPKQISREERRTRRIKARQKREKEIDQQIEETIEAELKHTLETRKTIGTQITKEKKIRTISEEKLDELLWDLEVGLLESDVAYTVIESIKNDIKEEIKYASIQKGQINTIIEQVLKHAITHVLESNTLDFNKYISTSEKPVVIMFVGVNGSGKTLSIGKMATMLKKQGYSCVMAAGDTFRAGAIEQLNIHADKVGVKIIKHGPNADPAAVAYDAIEHAKAKHKDIVLLDTAGRMQTNINLMDEMAKIKRVAQPDLILFVGDALSGNDAVEQAKRFNEIVGLDGVILTKVDTDAKGGSALSVAYTIGKPLLFIGVGQGYEDQIPFDAQWMINNIFGIEE